MRVREDAQAEVEGIVCCDNDDGTYDIILDDGSDRDAVPSAQIRPLPADAQGEGGDAAGRRQLQHACLINSARCAFQTGQSEMAVALATQAIDKNPANPAARFSSEGSSSGTASPCRKSARASARKSIARSA